MKSAAVFLDRDNTLIEDPGYLADPTQVRLLSGAADAVRRWNHAGYRVVVVTNQSGLARGLITETQLQDIHAQIELLLEEQDAKLDGIYHCPYLDGPEAVVPKYRRDSHLRKPRPGMLLKAADELSLDLSGSWMVGDSVGDMQAGQAAGCRTILISEADDPQDEVASDFIVDTLPHAADVILNGSPAAATERSDDPADESPHSPALTGQVLEVESLPENELDVLKDIRALLLQQRREDSQSDFSLARLGATLFQFVAVAILLWGIAAFVSDDRTALVRFVLAGVVQLGALTLFLVDRSK